MSTEQVRPTKKQRELLSFIEAFIAQHGYSPSYREIMTGLNYTSVATVALHVNSLIKRGHLLRRDGKARSLEVAHPTGAVPENVPVQAVPDEQWLVDKVEHHFADAEQALEPQGDTLEQLRTLVHALKVLGLEPIAQSFDERYQELQSRTEVNA